LALAIAKQALPAAFLIAHRHCQGQLVNSRMFADKNASAQPEAAQGWHY
jgi:hypothetical protein